MSDEAVRRMLADLSDRHRRPPAIGCGLVAHRDLGFCALCVQRANPGTRAGYGASTEISGWRLLAMVERGMPDQPR